MGASPIFGVKIKNIWSLTNQMIWDMRQMALEYGIPYKNPLKLGKTAQSQNARGTEQLILVGYIFNKTLTELNR